MSNLKDVSSKAVKITLSDGVERELRYTLNAMAEMEDRYGSVDATFEALNKNSMKAVRFVLWVGLMDSDPGLTEQQVGSLIDTRVLPDIMRTVEHAFDNDMPEDKQVPNGQQPVVTVLAN